MVQQIQQQNNTQTPAIKQEPGTEHQNNSNQTNQVFIN